MSSVVQCKRIHQPKYCQYLKTEHIHFHCQIWWHYASCIVCFYNHKLNGHPTRLSPNKKKRQQTLVPPFSESRERVGKSCLSAWDTSRSTSVISSQREVEFAQIPSSLRSTATDTNQYKYMRATVGIVTNPCRARTSQVSNVVLSLDEWHHCYL